jgi:lariat debranching enzyme
LKPQYWFSAHLHVKFQAVVQHQSDEGKGKKETKFLALDKCLPRRKFLQVLDIGQPVEGPVQICYDKEWLSVLKSTNHLLATDTANNHMPGPGMQGRWDFAPTDQELNDITQLFEDNFTVPKNFEITSPPYDPQQQNIKNLYQTPNPQPKINRQTEVLCEKLKIDDPLQIIIGRKKKSNTETNIMSISKLTSELTHEEMDIPTNVTLDEVQSNEVSFNKDEIMLDDESDDSNSPQNVDVSVAQSIGSDLNGSVTKKSKMQLPEPKSDTGLHLKEEMQLPSPIKPRDESDYTTENIIKKEIEKETGEVEKVNEKEEENVNDLQKVAFGSNKKLKRRNVAIYEENDDD